MRILIVDDEPMICMLLADYIAELGHEVMAEAHCTADALRALSDQTPDMALLDVNLNGHIINPVAEACAIKSVPVIITTGYGKDSIPDSLKDYPMLQKPFSLDGLRKLIGINTA